MTAGEQYHLSCHAKTLYLTMFIASLHLSVQNFGNAKNIIGVHNPQISLPMLSPNDCQGHIICQKQHHSVALLYTQQIYDMGLDKPE